MNFLIRFFFSQALWILHNGYTLGKEQNSDEARDDAAIIDEILAEMDAQGLGITLELRTELEMGHWQVNGIDIMVRDSLLQESMIEQKTVRLMMVDVVVKAPQKEAFMKLMQSKLNENGYLVFKRGNTILEARLETMVYSISSSGYNVRLTIYMKGYVYQNENLERERIQKAKDVWTYFEGKGSSIKGIKSFFNQ